MWRAVTPEMSKEEVSRALEELFGVKQPSQQAAASVERWGISERTTYKWLAGERAVQPIVRALIEESREVNRLRGELEELKRRRSRQPKANAQA